MRLDGSALFHIVPGDFHSSHWGFSESMKRQARDRIMGLSCFWLANGTHYTTPRILPPPFLFPPSFRVCEIATLKKHACCSSLLGQYGLLLVVAKVKSGAQRAGFLGKFTRWFSLLRKSWKQFAVGSTTVPGANFTCISRSQGAISGTGFWVYIPSLLTVI